MSAETIYKELLDQFKADAFKAIEEAHATIQGDLLPYANDDTEHNARHKAAEMVGLIIEGEFKVEGSEIIIDGWAVVNMTNFNYDKLVDVLSAKAGDIAKDLKIERLERQIKEFYDQPW